MPESNCSYTQVTIESQLTQSSVNYVNRQSVRCVVISDTHSKHNEITLPKGDILIHTGDFTDYCTPREMLAFRSFLKEQQEHFEYILVIPGNHEFFPDVCNSLLFLGGSLDRSRVFYMRDEVVTVKGITFYGSRYSNSSWFNWVKPIPKPSYEAVPSDRDINIMLVHGPPKVKGHRDFFRRGNPAISEVLPRVNPDVYIFGHNHENYGVMYAKDCTRDEQISKLKTTFICACSLDAYGTTRKPIVFDFYAPAT